MRNGRRSSPKLGGGGRREVCDQSGLNRDLCNTSRTCTASSTFSTPVKGAKGTNPHPNFWPALLADSRICFKLIYCSKTISCNDTIPHGSSQDEHTQHCGSKRPCRVRRGPARAFLVLCHFPMPHYTAGEAPQPTDTFQSPCRLDDARSLVMVTPPP
jgi:hypothetical protein